ncbi:hypothetical protein DCAR_0206903 [Daucus carota subsp. sativus]|uniref:Uncharacterized protein n=1 Tax=Daucus carota subsp. sativus TaxID=79200 RepID=A0A162ASJ5_DAUCS|nr:PREDICTED: uncharacterized protein LOC108209210 [Daucus carota subsp. sativus]WOG87672.1 hypothetical protein DCAR_0206903 [Daucus carota subsp. sativus]
MDTNGSDSPNPKEIRHGMKREFAMMMKNQSQFLSIGRTRSSKSPIPPAPGLVGDKRARVSANLSEEEKVVAAAAVRGEVLSEEEEPKSGIVDMVSDDDKRSVLEEDFKVPNDVEGDSGEVVSDNTHSLRRVTRSLSRPGVESVGEGVGESGAVKEGLGDKIGEKNVVDKQNVGVEKRPKKLKELLETGLLEGVGVRYLRGSKVRKDNGLNGIIKGDGILCFCDVCGGAAVVSPNHFELHAGSANKRPPEYLYLENGRTLRDVLNACKNAPPEAVTATIKHAIGSSAEKPIPLNCRNCRASLPNSGDFRRKGLCVSCIVTEELQPRSPEQSDMGDRSPQSPYGDGSSDRNRNESLSRSKGKGRLTRKDLMMHKKGFEELAEGAEVAYFASGKKVLDGYKCGSQIYCFHCHDKVSPSVFEAHAGYPRRRKPYLHIYTSNGVSLHEWAVKTSLKREISAAENDDLCSICADGGDLLCCDTCPRAFHPECLSMQVIPEGKFHCRYCKNTFEKEKFVEHNANAVAAGRVSGVDPIEEITRRCIRIVETMATTIDGCVLCRGHDFSSGGFGEGTVIICDQCEKEYHVGCLKDHNIVDLKELPTGKWFCCSECSNIYSALESRVAVGDTELSDSLMDMIKKKHEEKGSQSFGDLNIRWRLLCGRTAADETRVLLSNAVAIFHEQFKPIANSGTREFDFIANMVNGKCSPDHDFGRMYCAILTVNSSVVSAGLFRIFNQEVAELPLVATGSNFQGLGYFQSLFSCIESLLQSVNVKDLVLPSADESKSIWTKKFGFGTIDKKQLNAYRKLHRMMVFQGTSMLHKPVCQISH